MPELLARIDEFLGNEQEESAPPLPLGNRIDAFLGSVARGAANTAGEMYLEAGLNPPGVNRPGVPMGDYQAPLPDPFRHAVPGPIEATLRKSVPGLIAGAIERGIGIETPEADFGPAGNLATSVGGLLVDFPLFGLSAAAGKIVVEGLVKRFGTRAVTQMLGEKALPKVVTKTIEAAVTLGGYDAVRAPLEHYVETGDVDALKPLEGFVKGALVGATALGPASMLKGPVRRTAAEMAGFAVAPALLEERAPTLEDVAQSVGTIGGLKLAGFTAKKLLTLKGAKEYARAYPESADAIAKIEGPVNKRGPMRQVIEETGQQLGEKLPEQEQRNQFRDLIKENKRVEIKTPEALPAQAAEEGAEGKEAKVNAVLNSESQVEGGIRRDATIQENGQPILEVQFLLAPNGVATVESVLLPKGIRSTAGKGIAGVVADAGTLGTGKLLAVSRALKRQFPDIQSFEGERLTGARGTASSFKGWPQLAQVPKAEVEPVLASPVGDVLAKQPWEMQISEFTGTNISWQLNRESAKFKALSLEEQAPYVAKQGIKDAINKGLNDYRDFAHDLARREAESGKDWTKRVAEWSDKDKAHEWLVRRAVAEGKPVPPAVLAEYPDLKPVERQKGTGAEIPAERAPVRSMPVSEIGVDPERFQFKTGVDVEGAGKSLKGAKQFDPRLAGVVSVWTDPQTGKTWVVNGHHRLALAKRSGVKSIDVRAIDAPTAEEARAFGALINIAEGRGTPVDAAKFMRDSGLTASQLADQNIDLTDYTAREAVGLTNLRDDLFQQVATGRMTTKRGALIGRELPDHADQKAIADILAKKSMTNEVLREMIRLAKTAPRTQQTEQTLFGEDVQEVNLLARKAEISAYVRQKLRNAKQVFGFVSNTDRAAMIEAGKAGVVDVEQAAKLSDEAAISLFLYDKLSGYKGPVADALNRATLVKGLNDAKRQAFDEVKQALAEADAATVASSAPSTETARPEAPKSFGLEVDLLGQPHGFAEAGGQGQLLSPEAIDATRNKSLRRKPPPKPPDEPLPDVPGQGKLPIDEPSGPTSIKNAVVDEERKARGLPPAMEEAKRSFQKVWDEASAIADSDPHRVTGLIDSLKENPKAIGDLDDALLLHRQIELQNEYDKALIQREAITDPIELDQHIVREDALLKQLLKLYDVDKAVGRETARGLNARKMLANEMFSLVKMAAMKRNALGVKTLDANSVEQIKDAHAKIADFQKKYDDLSAKMDAMVKERQSRAAQPRTRRTTKAKQELEATWKEVLSHWDSVTFANPVPQVAQLLADGVKVAKAYIKVGGAGAADFYADVKARFGEERFAKTQAIWEQAWNDAQAGLGDKELARIAKRKAAIEDKIARGDYSKKVRVPKKVSKAVEAARFDLEEAQARWRQGLRKDQRKRRSLVAKALDYSIGMPLDMLKSLKTTFDVSAVGRQGFLIGMGHPSVAIQNFGTMFKVMAPGRIGRAQESAVMNEIHSRENAHYYRRHDMMLEPGEEEAHPSNVVTKVPGIGASERSYRVYLNKLRADMFDLLMSVWHKKGGTNEARDAAAADAARFVKVFSGRGPLGEFERAAKGLNRAFFSPRAVASRFQALTLHPLLKASDPTMRRIIAKEYARTAMGIGASLSLIGAGLYGFFGPPGPDKRWEYALDPRSWKGLRLRIGRTWIDPWAGLAQVVRLGARLVTGKTAKESGRLVSIRGKTKFGERTAGDVVSSWFRSTLSPGAGTAWNIVSGTDYLGDEMSAKDIAWEAIVPIAPDDVAHTLKEEGWSRGSILGLLSATGLNVRTMEQPDMKRIKSWRKAVEYQPEKQDHENWDDFRARKHAANIDRNYARQQLQLLKEAG